VNRFERFLTLPEVHITRDYPLVADSIHFTLPRQFAAEVRPIQGFEAEELRDFFESVITALPYYNAEAKAGEPAKYTAHQLRDRIHDDLESVLVASAHEKLVGFCFSNKDDHAIWLAWLGVHPDYRRLGIGKLLLDRLEQRAKRLASHKIWCDMRPQWKVTEDKDGVVTIEPSIWRKRDCGCHFRITRGMVRWY
jgi:GNAT superfamily N-acetyltransferase